MKFIPWWWRIQSGVLIYFFALKLGPGESQSISLRFQPQQSPAQIQVLMFVYDEDGKNEETFLLNVLYR